MSAEISKIKFRIINFLVISCLLMVNTLEAQEIKLAPPFSSKELVDLPKNNWITNGGNVYNQRFSPLDQINKSNVADIKGVWRTRLNGSGLGAKYSGEAQPLVYDGIIYVITGNDDVFAISVDTGEIIWVYEAHLEETIDPEIPTTICCGWTSRGVGLGNGKIFVGQLDGRLVALDQKNGNIIWDIQAENWQDGFTITSAPLYYNDLVITGFAGGEFGTRGRVKAYNANDGSLEWTFYTIPGPGEFGHDTWPQDSDVYLYGGAPVWQTPAVDPELDLIYFSTGNAAPDFNGIVRPGDNLFSVSIVAIEASTGKYKWHFQQVHHDIWDYDSPNPVVLFDIEIDGKIHKALAEASKTGWFYILNREDGSPLIGIEEKPVMQEPRQATSLTQPFPIGDAFVPQKVEIAPEGYPPLVNEGKIFTPFMEEGRVVTPGDDGGANWPPSAYDPRTGLMYVCATDHMSFFRGGYEGEDLPFVSGERFLGGRFGGVPFQRSGIIAAMDMRTNKIVWRQRLRDPCYSGFLSTAGDIVFLGRNDGRLTALDSSDGSLLWEFQTGAGMNAPTSTFEYNGKQYLVAYSAGNLFMGSKRGDSVWLFSLDGTIEQVNQQEDSMAANQQNLVATNTTSQIESFADKDKGKILYDGVCAFCHGIDGSGGHGGGTTLANATDLGIIVNQVTNGLNAMPGFGLSLSTEDINNISAYVLEDLSPE